MTDNVETTVTALLLQIEQGDPRAADRLLPLVYDELRRLAVAKMASEKPGHTLQATALVHEAFLRLVNVPQAQSWHSRGHFLCAAAEAMRRILVENARRKKRIRHGGKFKRIELPDVQSSQGASPDTLLAVDEALAQLAVQDRVAADLVKMHFFAGLTVDEAAESLGISRATAYRLWSYARAVLRISLGSDDSPEKNPKT